MPALDFTLKIGSRGSALALAQSAWVRKQILARYPDVRISLKVIKTSADKNPTGSIRDGSAVGVFVKELEDALVSGDIDLAVHSMKDMPTRIPDSLEICAIPVREDARDALVANAKAISSLKDLPAGATVGTGSLRRHAQILALRPDLRIRDIRGNVDTRLQKLKDGYDAVVLACAGLNRLGLHERITVALDFSEMLPAPGQGALALEMRKADPRGASIADALHHAPTATTVLAERAFLRRLGGGCNSPIGVHASIERGIVTVEGLVATPDGSRVIRERVTDSPETAEEAAVALAETILSAGGKEILTKCGNLSVTNPY